MARRRKLQDSVPGPIGATGKVTLHDDRIVLIRPPYTRHGARQGSEDKGLRFEYVQQAVMGVLGALPPKDTKLKWTRLAQDVTRWLRQHPDKKCHAIVKHKSIDRFMVKRALQELWDVNCPGPTAALVLELVGKLPTELRMMALGLTE